MLILKIYTWLFRVGQKQLTQTIKYQYIRQIILYRVLYRVLLCKPYIFFCPALRMLQQPLVTQGQMILQRAKLSSGLSSNEWRNYKRTRQGALALFIYYIYTWLLVCATTISIRPLSPCRYLMSITHPPCVYLKATMLPTCALTSYL